MSAYYNDARKMGYEIVNFNDKGPVFKNGYVSSIPTNIGIFLTNYICNSRYTQYIVIYKNILPTNALFIKNIKCYNVYLTPTCFGPSWTIIREYTFVPR
jgi:hypothetical protein